MKDRIRQIMEVQHMTQQVFANYIGTTPATLSGIFNDRTRPTINIIESIKKKFPDISLEWLMFGQGDMFQQAPQSGEASQSQQPTDSAHATGLNGRQPSLSPQEPMLDFGTSPLPTPPNQAPATTYYNSVVNTHPERVREEVKYIDKPARKVTEIRVYYDDQTWESFVPSKK